MALNEICPTKDDFARTDWEAVIAMADGHTCDEYARLYAEKAREAGQAGDAVGSHVFELMYHICSLVLDLDAGPNWRGVSADDFQDCHMVTLEAIVDDITDAELRARVADVLWDHRIGGHRMAGLAVSSYLESADVLEDPENWYLCAERIERALGVAASLGMKNQPFKDVVAQIERVLDKYRGEDPLFLSAHLMEMLQQHGRGDPDKYAALAEKAALRAETEQTGIKWHKARGYWGVASRWHAIQGNDERARACEVRVAETFVNEAKDRLEQVPGSYQVPAILVQRAIECLRRVRDTKERREELQSKLVEYQKKSVDDFETRSSSVDVGEFSQRAIRLVQGKPLPEALLALALIASSPKVGDLRKRVESLARKSGLIYWIPMRKLDQDGRVVGVRPGLWEGGSQAEAALRAEMFKEAMNEQGLIAQAILRPAVAQILAEHNIRISDLIMLLVGSPFVPPGREYLFARGIHAGFCGDLVTAVHVLCPQVEHSIRSILADRGVSVWGLGDDGVQDAHSLTTNLYKPELVEILGEDMVFDLRGVLVERFGSNLRNQVGHGLMDQWEFHSANAVYLWWLVLRLCLGLVYAQLYHGPDSSDSHESVEGGGNDKTG